MTAAELLRSRREEILRIAARRGARRVRVSGSIARGEATEGSDIDLLVDLEPGRGILDLGGLGSDLSALLGVRVEVVTEPSLAPRGRARVLREAVPL